MQEENQIVTEQERIELEEEEKSKQAVADFENIVRIWSGRYLDVFNGFTSNICKERDNKRSASGALARTTGMSAKGKIFVCR